MSIKQEQQWAPLMSAMQIMRTSEHEIVARIKIPADLAAFEGHFPQAPVLPAVAVLEFSLYFGRQAQFVPSTHLAKIKNAKFFAAMRPLDQIEIAITKSTRAYSCRWQTHGDGDSKLRAEFEIEF